MFSCETEHRTLLFSAKQSPLLSILSLMRLFAHKSASGRSGRRPYKDKIGCNACFFHFINCNFSILFILSSKQYTRSVLAVLLIIEHDFALILCCNPIRTYVFKACQSFVLTVQFHSANCSRCVDFPFS